MRVALPLDFDVCSASTTSGCSTTSSVFGVDSGAGGVGGAGPSQYSVRLTCDHPTRILFLWFLRRLWRLWLLRLSLWLRSEPRLEPCSSPHGLCSSVARPRTLLQVREFMIVCLRGLYCGAPCVISAVSIGVGCVCSDSFILDLKMRTYIYVLGQTFTKKRPLVRHIDDYAKERDVVVVQIDDNPCVALNLEIDAGQRLVLSNLCSPYLTRSDDMPLHCNQNWRGSS